MDAFVQYFLRTYMGPWCDDSPEGLTQASTVREIMKGNNLKITQQNFVKELKMNFLVISMQSNSRSKC